MDEELIAKFKSGDEQAFEQVFNLYYKPLCLYADSFLRDSETSKDIVEEIFIQVWLKVSNLEVDANFKNYLYRSVHNNCIKHLKKRQKTSKLFADNFYNEEETLNHASGDYPLSNLITREMEIKIMAIMEKLPKQCRRIFELSRYENLTYPQIAQKLSISTSTVKTQMSRAMQKFRDGLGDYMLLLPPFILFCLLFS